MKNKIMCISAALALLITGYGCNSVEKNQIPDKEESSQIVTEDTTVQEKNEEATTKEAVECKDIEGINPLTGEYGYDGCANGLRPVAVMVNNIKAALPQYGVAQADIIYEVPVEGGITRLMAVYADFRNVPDVCSVRSCRYYYPILCLGMDAIYVHWGEDKTIALETLNRTGIDNLDGEFDRGMFYRDGDRAKYMATEHTGYIRGSELPDMISSKGYRTNVESEYSGTLFSFSDEEKTPDQLSGAKVTLNFSGEYFSTFEYDTNSGTYKKLHCGSPHMDGKTDTQLEFENVLVLQTNIHPREDGYLMDVALSGGTGYYFSNGGGQIINWTKTNEKDKIRVFDESGKELEMTRGKSYIGIIGSEKNIEH